MAKATQLTGSTVKDIVSRWMRFKRSDASPDAGMWPFYEAQRPFKEDVLCGEYSQYCVDVIARKNLEQCLGDLYLGSLHSAHSEKTVGGTPVHNDGIDSLCAKITVQPLRPQCFNRVSQIDSVPVKAWVRFFLAYPSDVVLRTLQFAHYNVDRSPLAGILVDDALWQLQRLVGAVSNHISDDVSLDTKARSAVYTHCLKSISPHRMRHLVDSRVRGVYGPQKLLQRATDVVTMQPYFCSTKCPSFMRSSVDLDVVFEDDEAKLQKGIMFLYGCNYPGDLQRALFSLHALPAFFGKYFHIHGDVDGDLSCVPRKFLELPLEHFKLSDL